MLVLPTERHHQPGQGHKVYRARVRLSSRLPAVAVAPRFGHGWVASALTSVSFFKIEKRAAFLQTGGDAMYYVLASHSPVAV